MTIIGTGGTVAGTETRPTRRDEFGGGRGIQPYRVLILQPHSPHARPEGFAPLSAIDWFHRKGFESRLETVMEIKSSINRVLRINLVLDIFKCFSNLRS